MHIETPRESDEVKVLDGVLKQVKVTKVKKQDLVDTQLARAKYFEEYIAEHPRLKLIFNPEYLNVCFQVIPKNPSLEINQFNLDLRFKMAKQGRFLVNYSQENGLIFFRQVFCNTQTTKEDLKYFLDELIELDNNEELS